MSMEMPIGQQDRKGFMTGYLEALALVERLHRLLLDVIKDEFERPLASCVFAYIDRTDISSANQTGLFNWLNQQRSLL